MNSMHDESQDTYQPLQPFSYPRSIQFFLFLTSLGIFIHLPYFLYNNFPRHYKIGVELQHAEKCFADQNYPKAIAIYEKMTKEFKCFTHGKIRIAQSCFALSQKYADLDYQDYADYIFYVGLDCLELGEFNNEEIKNLEKYVPNDRINEFKSIFITVPLK